MTTGIITDVIRHMTTGINNDVIMCSQQIIMISIMLTANNNNEHYVHSK